MSQKQVLSHSPTEKEEISSRPPVRLRSATFFASIPEKNYEKGYGQWNRLINANFPDVRSEPRWRFELDGYDGGLPKLKDTSPAMWVDSWHEKRHGPRGGSDTVRVFADEGEGYGGVTFTVVRNSEEVSRSFEQLEQVYADLLAEFQRVFDVSCFRAVSLEYVNIVDTVLYPEFKSPNGGGVLLGKVLSTHEQLEMPGKGFTLPYTHKMTFRAHDTKPMQASVSVEAHTPKDEGGGTSKVELEVEFTVRSFALEDGSLFSGEKAQEEMSECHEIILEFYNATFTDEAKGLFDGTIS